MANTSNPFPADVASLDSQIESDIYSLYTANNLQTIQETKKEIANIPFLKQVFACMKAYMIDREDVRQAMQVIINVTKEVKKGRS